MIYWVSSLYCVTIFTIAPILFIEDAVLVAQANLGVCLIGLYRQTKQYNTSPRIWRVKKPEGMAEL